jgi:hypothetical protein
MTHRYFLLAAIAFAFVLPTTEGRTADLTIVPAENGWDGAGRETVRRVLGNTADSIRVYFPDKEFDKIVVEAKGGPIVLFRRGGNGEYFVKLNTGGTYWSQYSYQFAHEFCHILCKYDDDNHGNEWFEESVCEMASIFALRKMSESWKTKPPFDHWKSYSKHLKSYADDRIKMGKLSEEVTFDQWYRDHARELHETSTDRKLNQFVAVALLPLFEESPEQWQSVQYLNDSKVDEPQTLKAYLAEWKKHSPKKHHKFIDSIVAKFGL